MTNLNRIGAKLMHKYNAHAATDVTGFGLIGHAQNLCKFQNAELNFIIHTIPIFENVRRMAMQLEQTEKLHSGRSVETSGGLLVCVPSDNALSFCAEYNELTGDPCWIVGDVVEGYGSVEIVRNPTIIDVALKE